VAAALVAGFCTPLGTVSAADPAGAPVATAPSAKLPVEAFGALPFLSGPEISPDGRHLVAGSVIGGKKAVVLADLDAPGYSLQKIALPDNVEVIWTRWAGNGKVLLSLLVPGKLYGVEFKSSRMLVYDVQARTVSPLADKVGGLDGDNVIFVDPAGAFLLVSAQRSLFEWPSVLRYDLATLKAEQVVNPKDGVARWYADPHGVVRAGLGRDGDRWWLYYRENEQSGFRRVAKGKSDQTMFDVEKLVPVAGSDKGYVLANKATGRYGVYRYDFVTDTIGEPVFENKDVDIDSIVISPRTGDLEAIRYVEDRDRVMWLDAGMKALQARLDRALPELVNDIVSRDAADRRMVIWSSSASDAGGYYVFDRAKGEMKEFARPYAALDQAALASVQPVRYAARDGLQIPAYLTLPLGRKAAGLPLVILPHGGPFLRDKWEYSAWVQFLANRGYAVLQPNFRGSTGYGKPFVDAATGEFGRKMQDDLDDGVRWLVSRGLVDPKRVCIMGGSYGGYAALWAAVRNPDIYRCAISFAGISDVGAMLRYDRGLMTATRYYRDWRDRIRGDAHFDLDAVSPIRRAAEIKMPLLIAHGKDDTTVPPGQSIKLHEALEKSRVAHEYVLYPDEGHGFSKVEDSVDFLKRVDAFLAKYNPAG
jgi:dipeptidyl aminopeptidase/acylaminoacyl peptidase